MIKVSTNGMVVSSKMELRFPRSGQQGHGRRNTQLTETEDIKAQLHEAVLN